MHISGLDEGNHLASALRIMVGLPFPSKSFYQEVFSSCCTIWSAPKQIGTSFLTEGMAGSVAPNRTMCRKSNLSAA
jgi:hypothetical protein